MLALAVLALALALALAFAAFCVIPCPVRQLRAPFALVSRRLVRAIRAATAARLPFLCTPRRLPDVYLEGNIGAGKSTLATALSSTGRFSVFQEPVAEWRNLENVNFLRLLQGDYRKFAFLFQVVVLATLARRLRYAAPSPKQRIFERSSRCALDVFCRAAEESRALAGEQMVALRAMYEATAPTPPVIFIYIRTPPDVARQRTIQRGRPEEDTLSPLYFAKLHRLMDDWLLRDEANAVHVLNGLLPPGQLLEAALEILEQVARAH